MVLGAAAWLAGCAVIGPTIPVAAGPGKSTFDWERDQRECRAETDAALQPQANAMNGVATSADQVAANNAKIEQMYDADYGHCLTARDDLVPAPAVPQPSVPRPPTPERAIAGGQRAIDASNTPGLSDPVSESAKDSVAPKVREFLQACAGESIEVDAHDAPISPAVTTRLVSLSQPAGGDCLGSMGELDYLLVRHGSGWMTLLSGYIGIRDTSHAGFRDVELRSRGACVFNYAWDGKGYAIGASNGCSPELAAAPPAGTYAYKARGH